jgi:hypothetical protein
MENNKHRWIDDTCKYCGVVRKKETPLSKNLIGWVGDYNLTYLVKDQWINKRPNCIKK